MDKTELKRRTKQFALSVIRLVQSLPRDSVSATIGHQLLRASTSVGANYRAACRAKATADFISKMGTVEEEADESQYWIELLVEAGLLKVEQVAALMQEADELVAITVSSIQTARLKKSSH